MTNAMKMIHTCAKCKILHIFVPHAPKIIILCFQRLFVRHGMVRSVPKVANAPGVAIFCNISWTADIIKMWLVLFYRGVPKIFIQHFSNQLFDCFFNWPTCMFILYFNLSQNIKNFVRLSVHPSVHLSVYFTLPVTSVTLMPHQTKACQVSQWWYHTCCCKAEIKARYKFHKWCPYTQQDFYMTCAIWYPITQLLHSRYWTHGHRSGLNECVMLHNTNRYTNRLQLKMTIHWSASCTPTKLPVYWLRQHFRHENNI